MDFSLIVAVFLGLWVCRLLEVNRRLRNVDPMERAWLAFERRNLRDPRHPSSFPRSLPR